MEFSLFFTYANTNTDKEHFRRLSKAIHPFVKSKSGELLNCENEDLLEDHAEKAHVIVVLLSMDYLDYDSYPSRQNLHNKISSFLCEQRKLVITVELEDCLWSFDDTFKGRQPHKLTQNASDYAYMPIIKKIIAEIEDQKPKVSFKKNLQESLFRLNYHEQRLVFNTHFKELSLLNILVTSGTLQCGQHLLFKMFLRFKHVHFYDEQKWAWLNAEYFNRNQTDNWLWQQMGVAFGRSPLNSTVQTIGRYIIERLQTEPILIRFDDIHLVKQESIDVIRRMWEQLYTEISSRNVTLKHQIFVFVTDRSGDDEDYSKMKNQFSSAEYAAICDRILCILPKIAFLSESDTEKWLSNLATDPELQSIGEHLKLSHILPNGAKDIPIALAVSNMIDALGEFDEDLKNSKNEFLARI
jgi:hypothetical protein